MVKAKQTGEETNESKANENGAERILKVSKRIKTRVNILAPIWIFISIIFLFQSNPIRYSEMITKYREQINSWFK